MAMKKFIDITDFSREELRETLNQITFLKQNASVYANELKGKAIINAFYEKNQFVQTAYSAISARISGSSYSYSHTPGRALKDEVAEMSAFSDAIVLSHPKRGAALAASLYSTVPVINAGDGNRAYPVGTLCDIASVWLEKNHVSNMKVGFLGDFEDNPRVRDLLKCLNIYKGNEFYFVSVNGKKLPEEYTALMDERERRYATYDNLFDILPELDVLFMTEVKKSSFENETVYEAKKENFVLSEKLLLTAKKDLVILHTFPRGDELPFEADSDPRAKYIKAFNYFADACLISIIKTVSGKAGRNIIPDFEEATHNCVCGKENCITSEEGYLPSLFDETDNGKLICRYCNQEL